MTHFSLIGFAVWSSLSVFEGRLPFPLSIHSSRSQECLSHPFAVVKGICPKRPVKTRLHGGGLPVAEIPEVTIIGRGFVAPGQRNGRQLVAILGSRQSSSHGWPLYFRGIDREGQHFLLCS